MISIQEVTTKKELKQFVLFPFELYKDSKYWVPPLIKDELQGFDKNTNPAFKNAEVWFYLAYQNNKIAGRIAVIINWHEINTQKINKIRFGWFDFIDDPEVSKALLNKVFEKGKEKNLSYAEGPIGFSNMDKVGAMTMGFERTGSMITWYNYPYYITHLENLGFTTEKEFIESEFSFNNVDNPDTFYRAEKIIKQKYNVQALNFTSSKDILPYVNEMFDVFNQAYASLSSFVAITDSQKEFFKNKYISLINPEYIKFVMDKEGKLVAFSVVMTSFSEALQKSKGKLFPFGFLHFLKAKRKNDTVLFYLIGILPEYQNKGVTALIFKEYYETFKKTGVKNCVLTPILVENLALQNLWKNFDPKVVVRRKTFKLETNSWKF
jgi:GNAT superfamily N-acetyltransferase